MSDYDPTAELELETTPPSSQLIQFAIENYGWEIIQVTEYPQIDGLVHKDYKEMWAKWSQYDYFGRFIAYPHWFKKRLLEQIKQKAETMEQSKQIGDNGLEFLTHGQMENMVQTGQGWAEPPQDYIPVELPEIHKNFKFELKDQESKSKTSPKEVIESLKHLARQYGYELDEPSIYGPAQDDFEVTEAIENAHHQEFEKGVGMFQEDLPKTLRQIQGEIYDWALQFGENESHDPRYRSICLGCDGAGEIKSPKQPTNPRTAWDEPTEYIYGPCSECKGEGSVPAKLQSLPPFLGMMEELGEIAAPVLKRHQGRGFSDEREYHAAVYDGIADLMIFLCDFANREGIDLTEALNKTWRKVQSRNQSTWQADKDKEVLVEQVLQDKTDLMGEDVVHFEIPKVWEKFDDPEIQKLMQDPSERKKMYQRVSAIGLQYGDQNLTNIEEGLLKRLMLIAEDAEARLHGRDAKDIRSKLNEIRKLRPDIMGEPKSTLEKQAKIGYSKEQP